MAIFRITPTLESDIDCIFKMFSSQVLQKNLEDPINVARKF